MKKHLLAFFGLALFLAGCGGGTPPPSSITLTVEDPQGGFQAAAYQVGTGSWTAISSWSGSSSTKTFTFSLNNQTKYGVAVQCGSKVVEVIQATSTELANPKIVCSSTTPSTVSFTVDVNITDTNLLAGVDNVCVNDYCKPANSGNSSYSISLNLEPGTRDLLVTLKDSSGLVKVAKVAGVTVAAGGNASVSLGSSDQITPVPFDVPSAPQGYAPYLAAAALVGYVSASRTVIGFLNASLTSYRPVSGFGSGDLYWAFIGAYNNTDTAVLRSFQFFNSGAPNLTFPDPWASGSLTVTQDSHPKVTGLTRNDSGLQGYEISLEQSRPFRYTAILSKAWLGSAGSYTLPDLSSLLGYTPLQNGDTTNFKVTALLSNKTALTDLYSIDLTNPSDFAAFAAGDYIKLADAHTSFTVDGGSNLSLP